jgi:sigma-B regulation protein RsbU (phosphoserine phosphatase)
LYSGMLQMQSALSSPEKAKSLVLKIESSAERMHALTNGLREYLSVDDNQYVSKVSLREVFNAALEKIKSTQQVQEIELMIEGSEVIIEGYRAQLELMFTHLIDNAVKFKHSERKLHLRASFIELDENLYRNSKDKYKFSRHARIAFSDNGIGFDQHYDNYVLQMLNKLESRTRGIGLGLSLVMKVVENHNGHLKLTSIPGTGTTLIIDLPLEN